MILLDTNALLWASVDHRAMGHEAKTLVDQALAGGRLGAPTITFLEAARLHWDRRVDLGMPPDAWRRRLVDRGLREVPLTGRMAVVAAGLEARHGFHGDPADQMVTATALVRGGTLVTSDRAILGWAKRNPTLKVKDARR